MVVEGNNPSPTYKMIEGLPKWAEKFTWLTHQIHKHEFGKFKATNMHDIQSHNEKNFLPHSTKSAYIFLFSNILLCCSLQKALYSSKVSFCVLAENESHLKPSNMFENFEKIFQFQWE